MSYPASAGAAGTANGAVERMVLLGLTSRIIPKMVGARRRGEKCACAEGVRLAEREARTAKRPQGPAVLGLVSGDLVALSIHRTFVCADVIPFLLRRDHFPWRYTQTIPSAFLSFSCATPPTKPLVSVPHIK